MENEMKEDNDNVEEMEKEEEMEMEEDNARSNIDDVTGTTNYIQYLKKQFELKREGKR